MRLIRVCLPLALASSLGLSVPGIASPAEVTLRTGIMSAADTDAFGSSGLSYGGSLQIGQLLLTYDRAHIEGDWFNYGSGWWDFEQGEFEQTILTAAYTTRRPQQEKGSYYGGGLSLFDNEHFSRAGISLFVGVDAAEHLALEVRSTIIAMLAVDSVEVGNLFTTNISAGLRF